ncbi:MAG: sigma-54 dependent transcriptional regulator [Planctomycetota bacterium]
MSARILLAEDDRSSREATAALLRSEGYEVVAVSDGRAALEQLDPGLAAVISDFAMPQLDGLQLLEAVRRRAPDLPLILLTGQGNERLAVQALKHGAFHYLPKPAGADELLEVVEQACKRSQLARALAADAEVGRELLGTSAAMRALRERIRRAAAAPSTVLIQGESGTGKELVARALHAGSPHKDGPFVAINCAALPEQLVESELFGHVRGAFTGAHERREGKFRAAAGGTLLIDEIGDMPLELQAKLLRVLESRRVTPLGSDRELEVDARVLASTHRDLAQQVAAGAFREDLFYRLDVVRLEVPPLRERREDVPLLASLFLRQAAARAGRPAPELTAEALARLEAFDWPGNVRQLKHTIEGMVVMAAGDVLDASDLPRALRDVTPDPLTPAGPQTLAELERAAILRALEDHAGNRTAAAEQLGISVRTLQRRLKDYGIND